QPSFILDQRVVQYALLQEPLQIGHTRRKPLTHHLLKIASGSVAVWNFKLRKWIRDPLDLDVASRRDAPRPAQGGRQFTEHLGHLRGRLKVKLVGREFHSMSVAHRLSRLYTEQDFLRMSIGVMEIMAIVR